MTKTIGTREVYITNKLWSYFCKVILISFVMSVLTHILGYPANVALALEWGIPSLAILGVGNFIIKKTYDHPAGKYLLILITTVILFIGLWVTPSPYLLGLFFITVIFSVFYLNPWVTTFAVILNIISGVILIHSFPRINTLDGWITDSLNLIGTYVILGTILYSLSTVLKETIQEHAAAREIQDILSLGSEDGIILIDNNFKVVNFKDGVCQDSCR